MDKKILDRYFGKSKFKKDARREELLHDSIDLEKWEHNLIYVQSGIERDRAPLVLELEESEDEKQQIRQIINSVDPTFAKVIDNRRGPLGGMDFPQALVTSEMLWYIAAYPDVVDFFYPTVTYFPFDKKRVDKETEKIEKIRADRRKVLRVIENAVFPNIEESEPTHFDYFVALKNAYKDKKKLLLSK